MFLWNNISKVFKGVLEPIATPETLQQLPHPGKTLYEHCQKQGKQVGLKHWVKGSKHRTTIYVDGVFMASHWSNQKDISKLNAAKEALQKLAQCEMNQVEVGLEDKQRASRIKERGGIERPEQKFTGLCSKKKLQKPGYRFDFFFSLSNFCFMNKIMGSLNMVYLSHDISYTIFTFFNNNISRRQI